VAVPVRRLVMKRYVLMLGDNIARVYLMLPANSPEEAVEIVRAELEQKRQSAGNTKADPMPIALQMGKTVGFDLSEGFNGRLLPEFSIDMPSTKFDELCVLINPAAITVKHVITEYSVNEAGELHSARMLHLAPGVDLAKLNPDADPEELKSVLKSLE
jgi:hypothetical protein